MPVGARESRSGQVDVAQPVLSLAVGDVVCGAPLEADFRGLIGQAASIRLTQDDTKWTRWQRYSSRQDRRMEWEGIIGRATYEGDIAPFWKFLKFGELVHVGHGATFGLGKYRVVEAESAHDGRQSKS